jgi:hypothetical protein
MRGGRMRLHWHRESALGSGLYVPTNNYFPERATLLQAFRAVMYDPAKRAWQVFPTLETPLPEELDGGAGPSGVGPAAPTAAPAAPAPAAGAFSLGGFVFLRNARFRPEAETPLLPR